MEPAGAAESWGWTGVGSVAFLVAAFAAAALALLVAGFALVRAVAARRRP